MVTETWTALGPELRFWMVFISYFAVAARVSWVRHQERRRLPLALVMVFLALNVMFVVVGPPDLAIGLMALILAGSAGRSGWRRRSSPFRGTTRPGALR
jgi:hypothetical protein